MGHLATPEALLHRWEEMQHDPSLQDLPYKIELNAWGKVEMSPASVRHAQLQAALAAQLVQQLAHGVAMTECPVLTDIGIRVPDLAWASADFMNRHHGMSPLPRAGDLRRGHLPVERRRRDHGEDARLSRRRGAGGMDRVGGRQRALRRSLRRTAPKPIPDPRDATRPDQGLPMKRENVLGRANVDDTPQLEAYYAALEGEALGALWNVANEIEPWHPQPKSVPFLWQWKRIEPLVRRAPQLVSAQKAARRVVMLVNPGRREWSAAAGLLYTGVQVMNPGEFTSAHRHQASALRFIMEGRGAYTVVDGERMSLGARDLVLTPNGTWHDHGIEAAGTQCIWQDGLDIPLMNALDANFFEVHPDIVQKPAPLPREGWSKPYSPVFRYGWDESLENLRTKGEYSQFDGTIHEYKNPLTGGPVMPTIGAQLQLLRPGEETKTHRHTGSAIYQVAKGRGWSVIAGRRFEWEEKDIFALPSWAPHSHANGSSAEEAVLFSFNDLPAMKALGIYREAAA